jgi:hypothetical protein
MTASISYSDLDAAIVGYLPLLSNEQKTAILNILEAFAPEPEEGSRWVDPDFVAEMDRRYEDYKSGRNIRSFEDVKSAIDEMTKGIKK